MQHVIAAITDVAVAERDACAPSPDALVAAPTARAEFVASAWRSARDAALERHAVLGPARPGELGSTVDESSSSVSVIDRLGVLVWYMPCALA